MTVCRALRRAGFTTSTAPDGESALREVLVVKPALVVSDVLMPGINGFQVCRQLKANPDTAAIPVIMMSGKTDPADHFWAEEVGARILLRKPVDDSRLLAEIARALTVPP